MPRSIRIVVLTLVFALAATAGFAQAKTSDSPLNDDNITASVIGNCKIDTFNLAFGDYDPIDATDLDASTTVDVFCTKGVSPTVTLDEGVNGARVMTDGTDDLDYELYSDSGRTAAWQTTAPGVATGAATGPLDALTLTIYGRVFAEQSAQVGSYVDTVVATVNW